MPAPSRVSLSVDDIVLSFGYDPVHTLAPTLWCEDEPREQ
jgi:hypothetical protein